ncbi:hypothetical protein MTO96_010516 [Rhipicephalus appendiculatus]
MIVIQYNLVTQQSALDFKGLFSCFQEATHEMKKSYRELTKRLERQKELKVVEQKMIVKKKLLDKKNPPVKKVREGTKDSAPVYLWKKERKR